MAQETYNLEKAESAENSINAHPRWLEDISSEIEMLGQRMQLS